MDGGSSISMIRQFVFGREKQTEGWKFNSLTHQKKKNPSEFRTPSFKLEPKKLFFQTWVLSKTSSRYASTPDLKESHPDLAPSYGPRPSVKKLVKNFENSVSKGFDSSSKLEPKGISFKSRGRSKLCANSESDLTSAGCDKVSVLTSSPKWESSCTRSPSKASENGVSNPLYLALPSIEDSESIENEACKLNLSNDKQLTGNRQCGITNSQEIFPTENLTESKSPTGVIGTVTMDSTSMLISSTPKQIHEEGENLSEFANIQDSNPKDASADPIEKTKDGKTRRPPERRESGRFQSAARILRSLGRSREPVEDGRALETSSLNRSNPHYHSEGKGANKQSVEKEPVGVSHKERSKSFCDKPEAKKRYTPQESKKLRKGSSASKLLERREKSSSELRVELSTSSLKNVSKHESTPVQRNSSMKPSQNFGGPKLPEEDEVLKTGGALLSQKESDQPAQSSDLSTEEVKALAPPYSPPDRKGPKPNRKLTKDSGYETSPYSEGDYALLTPCESELCFESKVQESSEEPVKPTNFLTLDEQHEKSNSISNHCTENHCIETPRCEELDSSQFDGISPELQDTDVVSPPKDSIVRRYPSTESLTTSTAEPHLGEVTGPSSASLPPARSTPTLCLNEIPPSSSRDFFSTAEHRDVNAPPLQGSRSTPNLEESEDETMVTKKLSMYSYLEGPSNTRKGGSMSSCNSQDAYWDYPINAEDNFSNPIDYAHHLRSSSYQLIHSRQLSSGSYHNRQSANYSDGEEICLPRNEVMPQSSKHNFDRSRCFSFDSLGEDKEVSSICPASWNISEPDLSSNPSISSHSFFHPQKYDKGLIIPPPPQPVSMPSKNFSSSKMPSSPPPPPVRDASSLKYIRYGPGHEKFPSWPVPASTASFVGPQSHSMNSSNMSYHSDGQESYSSPQGSHRSHSWTEQSEYPKEKCGGYARPFLKKQFSPSFQKQLRTVMEKCEKIPPEMFKSCPPEELLRNSNYSLIDAYLQQSTYYPLYDRDGRGIDDKDYSIPSPPEHDPGMGEAHLSQVTMEELEEHARRCDLAYGEHTSGDFPQITPLLDQLRQESYTWDGASERDSGRGESESFTDSRYSNGRESVATVVTNSSSASSSETLKWHGSLSDISIMSGHSRDTRQDQNIVHSARVQAPQRHNSESVLYYGRGKSHGVHKGGPEGRSGREGGKGSFEVGHSRSSKDALWSREVERNNEMNNLKKFPSYSYTQPLSQITEAPLAESGESPSFSGGNSAKSPTVDLRKPPSVAERINELERQSRTGKDGTCIRWQRDRSEPRDVRLYREDRRGFSLETSRKNSSEMDLRSEAGQSMCDLNYLESQFPASVMQCRSSGESQCLSKSEESTQSADPASPQSDYQRSLVEASYSYLDPDKKCKIPGATLKNIQKQALLSFYERRTGKSVSGSPSTSFSSPSSGGGDCHPSKWSRQSLRGAGRSGKGMARLGRVPDFDNDADLLPRTPIRTRSVSGGREKTDDIPSGRETSLSPLMPSPKELPPELPAKPLNPLNLASVNSSHNIEAETDSEHDVIVSQESYRRLSFSRLCNDSVSSPRKEPSSASKPPPSLPPGPSLPPLANEASPKPPERPPKKPNLRSLFHGSQGPTSSETPHNSLEPLEPEVKEQLTPRTYFYRKPPAPDPPQSLPDSLTDNAVIKSPNSRSPTPELPPPPPPPPINEELEVIVFDEPLPPPPSSDEAVPLQTSTLRTPSKKMSPPPPVTNGNYHKDSYMAHRRDWKTGYEGRYRRTQSPTATDRNIVNGRSKEYFINNNNNNNNNLKISHSMTTSPATNKPPVIYKIKGNMRSAVSTSSLLKRPTSPSNKDVHFNNTFNDNDCSLRNINSNISNDWTSHPYQTSTTVDFTSDELKAFKARQTALESKTVSSTSGYSIEFNSCDSLHYTSPLRPLTRAVSVGEPLHHHSEAPLVEVPNELHSDDNSLIGRSLCSTEAAPFHSSSSTLTSSPSSSSISRCNSSSETINAASSEEASSSSPTRCVESLTFPSLSPVSHDGPATAHPATVTEEELTVSPESHIIHYANSETIPSPTSPAPILEDTVQRKNQLNTPSKLPSSPSLSSTSATEPSSPLVSLNSSSYLNRSISTSNLDSSSSSTPSSKASIGYCRSLSSTGTYPAMTIPNLSPEELASRENIVVLSYGRTPNQEEVDCDKKSIEFVEHHDIDRKLHALLAPNSGCKSTACYMEGVFALEMRRDLLCSSHAKHPDLRNETINTDRTSTDNNNSISTEKATPPTDSTLSTASESKPKTMSKLRSSPTPNSSEPTNTESQMLAKRKLFVCDIQEDLIRSISRKIEILQNEQTAIKEEMALNYDLGLQVTSRIESRAKSSEAEKYKLHVEEIDKITSLLLGLSGRLARAENGLASYGEVDPEEKRILEAKRDKLKEQLEEAKRLKENIDRRAIQVSRIVSQYLGHEEYADYDHFTKMKAKLLMDAKEIDDKVKLGEEQLEALRKSLPSS